MILYPTAQVVPETQHWEVHWSEKAQPSNSIVHTHTLRRSLDLPNIEVQLFKV